MQYYSFSLKNREDKMKKILLFLVLILPMSGFASEGSVREIKSCFDSFKKYVMEKKGNEFISCVNKRSISYCSELVEDSLYLPADKFSSLSMIDRYLIMRINISIPMGILLKMYGKEFLIYSVSNGWFTDEFIPSLTIDNVSINGDTAHADIYQNGRNTGAKYKFMKEDGQWKFVFISHFAIINSSLKSYQLKSGKSENDYLKGILQPLVDYRLDDYIFEPVLKK